MHAIQAYFAETGGPEVIRWREVELPAPTERVQDDGRAPADRRATGRGLQAANDRLARRVEELERERETRGEELQPQLEEARLALQVSRAELERVTDERAKLEARNEELVQTEGAARGANERLEAEVTELREERDNLRHDLGAAKKQAAAETAPAEVEVLTRSALEPAFVG